MKNKIEKKINDFVKWAFRKCGFIISKIPKKRESSGVLMRSRVGKFTLLMKDDNQLPIYFKYQPLYSMNLPRLAVEVLKKYKDVSMIDVGANIGDTVALTRSKCHFPIACIEGDQDFFDILKRNMSDFKDVEIFKALLGEEGGYLNATLGKDAETARLKAAGSPEVSSLVRIITLDDFLKENHQWSRAKLLKIDTDGYDMKILRGAMMYIQNTKPVLFFEYDPVFLDENKEDGLSTLLLLRDSGYRDIIFYDNLGKLIISSSLENELLLKQMHNRIDKKTRTPFAYYDVAIFHEEDGDLAKKFIASEMSFYYKETV